MKRRKTDRPTEEELRLLTENHRLGARILELERAAEIDAAHLRNCLEDKEALRGSLAQLRRDYDAMECNLASICDALNTWARQERVGQAENLWEARDLISRLRNCFEAVVSENRSKCLELAESAHELREARRERAEAMQSLSLLRQGLDAAMRDIAE